MYLSFSLSFVFVSVVCRVSVWSGRPEGFESNTMTQSVSDQSRPRAAKVATKQDFVVIFPRSAWQLMSRFLWLSYDILMIAYRPSTGIRIAELVNQHPNIAATPVVIRRGETQGSSPAPNGVNTAGRTRPRPANLPSQPVSSTPSPVALTPQQPAPLQAVPFRPASLQAGTLRRPWPPRRNWNRRPAVNNFRRERRRW